MFQGMMRVVLIAGVVGYFASAFASVFFNSDTDPNKAAASTNALPKVMSPAEFSNKVNSLKNTTQSQLTQQAQDLLSASGETLATTPPVSGAPAPVAAPPATPTPAAPIAPAPTTITPSVPPPASTAMPTTTPQNDTNTPSTPYSGFGTGQNTSAPNAQPASGGNQGGWNIKY